MKKLLLCMAICVAVVFYLVSPSNAELTNVFIGEDRVVYDSLNNLYWYPKLTDFTGMTRAVQEAKIASLNYAGSSQWTMATWDQTSLLKQSLAGMATEKNYPTAFGPTFGVPISDPDIGSPRLAWNVDSASFFTPTGLFGMEFVNPELYKGIYADVFNGRTTGWGMTNVGVGGFWGKVEWTYSDADDHWVSSSIMNGGLGAAKLTMTYNFDQHRLPDDATTNSMMGAVGAWVVTSKVPEPSTMLLLGLGLVGLAGLRRK